MINGNSGGGALKVVDMIVRELVDKPDNVSVRQTKTGAVCVIEISADPNDIGKVKGKSGYTESAIRTLLNSIGQRERKRYILQVLN